MADYTKLNLKRDLEDQAPKFGYSPGVESRFARGPLGLERIGVSNFKVAPGFRMPFGHSHTEQEEVYLVVSGAARIKLDDEVVELSEWDAVRIPPGVMRGFEGGPDGAEIVAFGGPSEDGRDFEMAPDWWKDD